MINWKELEKFIAPGKVMTLVIMIDGKEIGALSFNVDTLAFKAILETVSNADVIKIADKVTEKPVEKKVETKKPDTKKPDTKKEPVDKHDKTKRHPEFNPVPAHDDVDTDGVPAELDQWKNEDNDDNGSGIDTKTGADKETGEITSHDINIGKATVADLIKQEKPITKNIIEPVAASTIDDEPEVKTEIIKTDVKDEKIQAPAQTGNQEADVSEELW